MITKQQRHYEYCGNLHRHITVLKQIDELYMNNLESGNKNVVRRAYCLGVQTSNIHRLKQSIKTISHVPEEFESIHNDLITLVDMMVDLISIISKRVRDKNEFNLTAKDDEHKKHIGEVKVRLKVNVKNFSSSGYYQGVHQLIRERIIMELRSYRILELH